MSIFDIVKKQKSKTEQAIAEATGVSSGAKPSFAGVKSSVRSTELPATYAQSQALKRRAK